MHTPLFSVFTPSHDLTHLRAAYDSLAAQDVSDWEWLVVPNHPDPVRLVAIGWEVIALGDSRVRVVPWAGAPEPGVGALKRFACDHCRGELLVELDHDDELLPGALAAVAAHAERQAGFYYSDALILGEDGRAQTFSEELGWRHYAATVGGNDHLVPRAFPVTPRSLAEVYFAPDHVRVWSRAAYATAGGHDPALAVGDDHDLLCRTYLAGTDMVHLGGPLYRYRLHAGNTVKSKQPEIKRASDATTNRYLHRLVAEWCRREDLLMVDLGGAHNPAPGYKTLDRVGDVDFRGDVFDLCRLLGGRRVGCFRAFDFLEHFPPAAVGETRNVVTLLNTLYDNLVDGGWLLSQTPAVADDDGRVGRGAFQDPTHRSYWSANNFWYFTDKNFARYVPEVRCRFQAVRLGTAYPSDLHRRHHLPYVVADLMAVKSDGPVPGVLKI